MKRTALFFNKREILLFNMKSSSTNTIYLYTDGACSGNPGPGGWASILTFNDRHLKISGYSAQTTNNKMELTAVIEGLKRLKKPSHVHIVTDSKYIHNAFSLNWITRWQHNNWKTVTKEPVKNKELWLVLLEFSQKHNISWEWVKGHAGHKYNELCDEMARNAIKNKSGIEEYA